MSRTQSVAAARSSNSASPPSFSFPTPPTTYLGPKGYTLLKSQIPAATQTAIKDALTVRPKMPGAPVQSTIAYPVYRESAAKLYVPRFFGESILGPAQTRTVGEGDDIDITFGGALREYQKPTAQKFLDRAAGSGAGLLELYCGFGKTDLAIYLMCVLKKKTLIIVHKDFLLNQWIERIEKYVPAARIGRIQGPIVDIDNKDVVLGMLNSLSMKNYNAAVFSSFGLTIIDEVHHISSEVFSCALFKLVTKYMLGLSATMDRKDGTTRVFKMFLGEVVDKQVREGNDGVVVQSIVYKSRDEEFNHVEIDYRGNTVISKMIGKLCMFGPRSEFILRVLRDVISETPGRQIMILAQYKSILKYMHDAIVHHNIASVGYYIGGMKQAALKAAESNTVILATYTMAAEGLDIKTLDTLFMITPMTNVEQSIGRILRQRHAHPPLVVDFVDAHSNFMNQWRKRRALYRVQKYTVLQTDSDAYRPQNPGGWRTLQRGATTVVAAEEEDDAPVTDGEASTPPVRGRCLLLP